MIRIRRLTVSYGADEVLRDLSLDIAEGSCVLLTGPSGCGKTTLARAVCGLIPHAIPARVSGEVWIGDQNVGETTLPQLAQRVGMVFQNPASQLFHLRVWDEVAFGPRNLGWSEEEVAASVQWALEVADLVPLAQRQPPQLSGGQQQRLAVAAALAMRPKVLVLDEPAASLDVASTRRLITTLRQLQRDQGLTILIIEHRLADVAGLADRAILMDEGRIVADGAPQAVFANQTQMRSLGMRRLREQPMISWQDLLDGCEPHADSQLPLVSLNHVSAGYGKSRVLHDLDLALYPGDFAALVGDNGAGKSTLALVASGLMKPYSGSVTFGARGRPRPGRDVALLFQNPIEQLFTDSVDDEVAYGPRNFGFLDRPSHDSILQRFDLQALRARPPLALSTGQQQRTAMAACAALRPRLLILDEPTQGQDWRHLESLMAYLALMNSQGTAILLITHDYKLVHRCARRIIHLRDGRIRADHLVHSEENRP